MLVSQAGAKRRAAEMQQENTIYEIQLQAASAMPASAGALCSLHARRPVSVLALNEAQGVSFRLQQTSKPASTSG